MTHPDSIPTPTAEQFADWRLTHPPIMGGAAPGQDAGGAGGAGGGAATAAQPGAGQPADQGRGDVDHLAGLYDLSTAPESLRPLLQDELRKINAGVGRRFQEHADFRQRFEPFEGLEGLSDTPPEDLEDLLAVRGMIVEATDQQNPNDEKLYEWWSKLGEHFDFFDAGDGGDGDPNGGDPAAGAPPAGDDQPPAWAQPLIQQVQEITDWRSQQEHQSAVQSEDQAIEAGMKALATKHSLDEDAQTAVLQLTASYPNDPLEQALEKGLADYFRISGKAEAGLVESASAAGQPGATTPPGGQPSTGASDEPMRLGDPRLKNAAKARMRGASVSGAAA